MTPDQALKAAILGDGETSTKRQPDASKSTPRTPRGGRRPRWLRWAVRLLGLAAMLMISQGLMKTPEVKAMIGQATEAVIGVIQKEQDARASEARRAAQANETSQATLRQDREGVVQSSAMPKDRGYVVRRTQQPSVSEPVDVAAPDIKATLQNSAEPVEKSGVVTAIHAANLIDVDGNTYLIDGIVCPAPDTDAGRRAALGLARLTQAQQVRCTVTGQLGSHAQSATCATGSGQDIANALRASGLCQ